MRGSQGKDRMKNGRGMTMAEVLAGLVIMSFLMLAAMKVVMSSTQLFYGFTDTVKERRMTDSLGEMLRDQITYAVFLEIEAGYENPDGEGSRILFTRDGRVLWNGAELYEAGLYRGHGFYCRVHLPESEETSNALVFTLFLENNRKEALYSVRTVVNLVNLELRGTDGIAISGELTEDGDLDSHDQDICFRFQSPGEEFLQEE